jgi:hypothetical protein
MTNGDTLVTGATGARGVMILINDYSNGNDMVIGGPGIESVKDLKGKKVGVEVGFVSHLLLLDALKEQRHERIRRGTGERAHQRNPAGAGLRRGGRHRRLAAQLRHGAEAGARFAKACTPAPTSPA